ncbi:MAG TPA: SgcJ/EcaC family oxidoreductase [Terracidiphilus sp.]|jgi:uncharacterized protein (TIGR02246 family)|nr:SgcJ/EcaC family oxidoreductase [Terracidiphilus sp.]
MKPVVILVAAALLVPFLWADTTQDEKTIRNMLDQEVASWNAGDAIGYSRPFTPDCTFTNIRGMFFKGQKAFEDRHAEIFKGEFRGTVLRQEVVSIRFVRPEVAIIETLTTVSNFPGPVPAGVHADDNGSIHTRLLQVFVKTGEDWKIATYHNVDLKAVPPK